MRHSCEGTVSPRFACVGHSTCTSTRHSSGIFDTCNTPSPSALDSTNSSIGSKTGSGLGSSHISEKKRTHPRSCLKTYKSAPGSLTVRFFLPKHPPPNMPGLESESHLPPSRKASMKSLNSSCTSLNLPTGTGREIIQIASPNPPLRSASVHRPAYTKRLSTPAPLSRGKGVRSAKPPSSHTRYASAQTFVQQGSRVESFQSIASTASAPAVLLTTPTSTPSSPSQPPSQYNPLDHYIPCGIQSCRKHHTPSLLGPTYYSKQQPYGFARKKGLCVYHANQDLKLAEVNAKGVWQSMRQNAGRKTLGQIAAEFEIWKEEVNEERAIVSEELEKKLRIKALGKSNKPMKESKRMSKKSQRQEEQEDRDWDWRYSPRPCTRKSCGKQWYSPYDNRLYFFYHVSRPSGLLPLMTLCPSCAKEDVEDAEDRMEGRRLDGGASVEWLQWCEQLKKDRTMEREFWEGAQERIVRERAVAFVGGGGKVKARGERREEVKKVEGVAERVIKEADEELEGAEKKRGKRGKIKDICVVM